MKYNCSLEDMIGFIHLENLLVLELLLKMSFPKEEAEKRYEELDKTLSDKLLEIVNGEFKVFGEE